MTNDEIIYNEVNAKYHTPEQRRAILALAYTPEQIAAKGKEIHFKDVPEERQGEELEKLLLAGLFHTFQEWKKDGKSVKTGEKATICTKLWKFDDRPRKTSASMEPDALTAAANDQRPDGNYYKAPAHLFHIGRWKQAAPPPPDALRAWTRSRHTTGCWPTSAKPPRQPQSSPPAPRQRSPQRQRPPQSPPRNPQRRPQRNPPQSPVPRRRPHSPPRMHSTRQSAKPAPRSWPFPKPTQGSGRRAGCLAQDPEGRRGRKAGPRRRSRTG